MAHRQAREDIGAELTGERAKRVIDCLDRLRLAIS